MPEDLTRPEPLRRPGPAVSAARPPAGGVVFDCDGVLADTIACWEHAFRGAAAGLGLTLSRDQLAVLHGTSVTTAAARLARWSPRPPAADELLAGLREHLVTAVDRADLRPIEGARALLDRLHGIVGLGVASNSPRAVLLRILARLEMTEYFSAAISAEDVPRPKPAPDPYLAACAALGIDPRASVAVEDSQVGVRSAVAAGLTVVELTGPPGPGRAGSRPSRSALRVTSLSDPRIGPLVLRAVTAGGRP